MAARGEGCALKDRESTAGPGGRFQGGKSREVEGLAAGCSREACLQTTPPPGAGLRRDAKHDAEEHSFASGD